jgi:hypothetical protein
MPCLAYDEGVTDCCERMSLRSDANGTLFLSRMASRKLRLRHAAIGPRKTSRCTRDGPVVTPA